jgi:hypothetical protein
VFTENVRRAHRIARALRTGTVWLNCFFVRKLRAPFGGFKDSGIGREGRAATDCASMRDCVGRRRAGGGRGRRAGGRAVRAGAGYRCGRGIDATDGWRNCRTWSPQRSPSCTGGIVIGADGRGHCRRTHVELTLPHLPQFHVVIPMKQVEPTGGIAFGSHERVRRGLPRPARNETNLATRSYIVRANGNGPVRRLPCQYSQGRPECGCQGSASRCPVYTRTDPAWNQSNSHC